MASTEDYGLREACGVFGCIATGDWPTQLDIPHIVCIGLVGLQHRGQESAGIVTGTGEKGSKYNQCKGTGYVSHVFDEEKLTKLRGNLGIGHTRYSTVGGSDTTNIQPFVVETLHGLIAVAHNGELVNSSALKKKLLKHGVGLSTGSDSELITQLLTHSPGCGEPNGPNWIGRIKNMMKETPCSYSLVIMHDDSIFALRDPYGNRPLCLGKLLTASSFSGDPRYFSLVIMHDDSIFALRDPYGNRPLCLGKLLTASSFSGEADITKEVYDGWVVSSESCSFGGIGAKYYREVLPGEIVELSREGIKSHCIISRPEASLPAFCIFEYVYFARPDSVIEGQMVYQVRQRCGRQLAIESPADVDLVSTVPESATPAALAYAQQLGIPYGEVLSKNRYVGRTFIQPSNRLRRLAVAKKFGMLSENFKDKRIVLIDDSIVRGNTMKPIIQLLKKGGAKEVHVRVASPPITHPCYMGINIPTKDELIANNVPIDKIGEHLGADSLKYLTVEGLTKATTEGIQLDRKTGHCVACLTGNYPTKLDW